MIDFNEYIFVTGSTKELPEGIYYVSTKSGIVESRWDGKHFLKIDEPETAYNILGWFKKISVFTRDDIVPELIVCAAVKFKERTQKEINLNRKGCELIIPMVRHYSPDGREVLESIQPTYEEKQLKEIEQGFITNKGRFVSRKEALEIAKANNQIRCHIGYEPKELYSEMLY